MYVASDESVNSRRLWCGGQCTCMTCMVVHSVLGVYNNTPNWQNIIQQQNIHSWLTRALCQRFALVVYCSGIDIKLKQLIIMHVHMPWHNAVWRKTKCILVYCRVHTTIMELWKKQNDAMHTKLYPLTVMYVINASERENLQNYNHTNCHDKFDK